MIKRCEWGNFNKLMQEYHDKEWGVPIHNDRKLFEFLILEGVQAGLNWNTILQKRKRYRYVFDDFNYEKISQYNQKKLDILMNDDGIIRNKLKINATVTNARAFLKIQKEYGTFNNYIWKFVKYKPIIHNFKSLSENPSQTKESEAMSKELKKEGFKFVGPTICYAFMQAVGMVNDHIIDCYRYNEINRKSE
jgi:DNA-3-methyladenine glycosylase I